MSEVSKKDRSIKDGSVVLFLRKESHVWQARLRRLSGEWIDKSTGEKDLEKAKGKAALLYEEMKYRQETGKVDVTRTFKSVALLTIKELQDSLNRGGKQTYRDYILAIQNYLIPCFDSTPVHRINHLKLNELETFRQIKIGHLPTKSTINTHHSALNRVFHTAVSRGFLLPHQIPELKNNGRRSKARPYFNELEWKHITEHLVTFVAAHQRKSSHIREILSDYVIILGNTGIRTGREALGLCWNNIETLSDGRTLQLTVNGKTGLRKVIARNVDGVVAKAFNRTKERLLGYGMYRQDKQVFLLPDGNVVNHERLSKAFKVYLKQHDLLFDSAGDERTLYSLRHMYATFRILEGVDVHTLAVNMGTSIKMLESHYSKLKPHMKADLLSGNINNLGKADIAELIALLSKKLEVAVGISGHTA